MSDKLSKARLEQLVKDATSATIGEAHNMARELLALREQAGEPVWFLCESGRAGIPARKKLESPLEWKHFTLPLYTAPPSQPGAVSVPMEQNVALQPCRDGLWAHFKCGDQNFSYNLDCDDMAKKFCKAYRAMLSAATSQTGRSRGG